MSPTQRTLKKLIEEGYICEVVEKVIPHTFIKRDLWGFDICSVRRFERPKLIQCTSASNHSARRRKILNLASTEILATSFDLEIWSWKKVGNRWTPRVEIIGAG